MTKEEEPPVAKLGRAVFCGLARNSGEALPIALASLDAMATLFDEVAFIMLENDSTDSTKADLRAWCAARPNAQLIEVDGLGFQVKARTLRLTRLRRHYLALVKAEYAHFDYMFAMDCDDANSQPIDLDATRRAVEFLRDDPDCAGVFANQDGVYMDLWALRCGDWCPGDVWEEALDYTVDNDVSDQTAFDATFRPRVSVVVEQSGPPLAVESAFGGLGVYKISSILNNRRTFVGYKTKTLPTDKGPREFGWQLCEHVSFNLGFRELGQTLYVLPFWINRTTPTVYLDPSGFRNMVFDLAILGPDR
ncbi:MAG: hypothetical protein WCI21_05115 [Alphaproteobacteria bacterium]